MFKDVQSLYGVKSLKKVICVLKADLIGTRLKKKVEAPKISEEVVDFLFESPEVSKMLNLEQFWCSLLCNLHAVVKLSGKHGSWNSGRSSQRSSESIRLNLNWV